MSRIPVHDVLAQNRSIQSELDEAWTAVNKSGQFINGSQLNRFETDFADYIGADHCVGVGNATDGFEIAYQALGFQPGDEVIIPANAHVSPALAALKIGLKPVFCDVQENSMLLNAETVLSQLSEKTRAVVAVHLYGRVCPMNELRKLCREKNLILIEDFSQAHGAIYKGQKVGSIGDVSVCSFYPTKPLGALGDGGAILTSNAELAAKCRSLANYGWNDRNNSASFGMNSRLDELQAAVLNVKLQYLDKWNTERLEKARAMQGKLGESIADIKVGNVCHLFVARFNRRDEMQQMLIENQFDCQVHYPIPIHKQILFNSDKKLPVSEKLCKEVLSIPPDERIVNLISQFIVNE